MGLAVLDQVLDRLEPSLLVPSLSFGCLGGQTEAMFSRRSAKRTRSG